MSEIVRLQTLTLAAPGRQEESQPVCGGLVLSASLLLSSEGVLLAPHTPPSSGCPEVDDLDPRPPEERPGDGRGRQGARPGHQGTGACRPWPGCPSHSVVTGQGRWQLEVKKALCTVSPSGPGGEVGSVGLRGGLALRPNQVALPAPVGTWPA